MNTISPTRKAVPDADIDEHAEDVLFKASPSQWINVVEYLLCAIAIALGVYVCSVLGLPAWAAALAVAAPVLRALWNYLVVKNIVYEVTSERVYTHSGVVNKDTQQCEMYRIRDYGLDRPIKRRIFGLADIKLITADETQPILWLVGMSDGRSKLDIIRNSVEKQRVRKRVREIDIG